MGEQIKEQKVLVLCSGGIDSTALLATAVDIYGADSVVALSMYYGQKHAKEQECAIWQAKKYGVTLHFADLSEVFKFNPDSSALLKGSSQEIIHKSYAEQLEDLGGEGTVTAYVPFRNGLFLSYAAAVAIQLDCNIIYYGAHADDAAGRAYPDCTPEFINAMTSAIFEGSGRQVVLSAPWWDMNKAEVIKSVIGLGVDFSHTWSCYEGGDVPCGECGTCVDRKAALVANGITDLA